MSFESELYYKRYLKYRDECLTINPETGCYKKSPKCPLVTVEGETFCLLNKKQCSIRAMKGSVCPPHMHYDEAKRKADFWVKEAH